MPKNKTGIDTTGILKIKAAINEFYRFIESQVGEGVDTGKSVVPENYLHTGPGEEESAAFERNNKGAFDTILSIQAGVDNIFKKYT